MSKHESWRTRLYWESVGGLLIEEFTAVKLDRSSNIGKRQLDGLIVLGEPKRLQIGGSFDVTDRDVVIVQTKRNKLGMYLMGQAFFSRELMKKHNPKSIRTVAICGKTDPEMERLCAQFDIEVVVISEADKAVTA